jgi:aconitate hydratase
VLGGWANVCTEYATKRYRSNLVNWGMLPFVLDKAASCDFQPGDLISLPGIRQALLSGLEDIPAVLHRDGAQQSIILRLPGLTRDERAVVLDGCLFNYYSRVSRV